MKARGLSGNIAHAYVRKEADIARWWYSSDPSCVMIKQASFDDGVGICPLVNFIRERGEYGRYRRTDGWAFFW